MSKKNKYYNRHSEEARLRDQERKLSAKEQKEKEREDAMWREVDPKVLKKKDKALENQQRQIEKARREAEKKEQLQREEAELNKGKGGQTSTKITRQQLERNMEKMRKEQEQLREQQAAADSKLIEPVIPEENLNRQRGVAAPGDTIDASGSASNALAAMQRSNGGEVDIPDDRHIGKRARVLYKAFYKANIEAVKAEKPGMRRSQYNDVLWEMWCKSPENPFVQRSEKRDWERLQADRAWLNGVEEEIDAEEEKGGDMANEN